MEIMEKKLKSILTEQRKEFQRHTAILVEEFISQIKLIAESIGGCTAPSHSDAGGAKYN